jgi:hypothetical protein
MEFRDLIFENLIGDLDYDPKRGALYLCLSAAALCFWVLASPNAKFSPVPMVLGAGGITLFLKGVFLLRKTSKGLDTSQGGLSLSTSTPEVLPESASSSRPIRPWPSNAAQLVQDFGAGSLLLWPVLHVAESVNEGWNPPVFPVALGGAAIFLLGWGMRRILRTTHAIR